MIVLVLPAAILAFTTLFIEYRLWRRGAAGEFVLATVPVAALFLILPAPFLMFLTIRGFQRISEQGVDAARQAAELGTHIDRVLLVASFGTLIAMLVAALLQRRASNAEAASPSVHDARRKWAEWTLMACPLIILPTALLMAIVQDVPRLTIRGFEMTTQMRADPAAVVDLSGLSERISSRLVLGTVIGVGLCAVAVCAGAAALVAFGNTRSPRRSGRYAWAVFMIVIAGGMWNGVRLYSDLGRLEHAAAAAATQELAERSLPTGTLPHSEPSMPDERKLLRFDGVYRTDKQPDGLVHYWSFLSGGQCWPYEAPLDNVGPPSLPAREYWMCQATGESLVLMHSVNDAVVATEKGSIKNRDTIVVQGLTYRFIEREKLQ